MANNREYGGGVLHSNVVISLNANDAIEITDVGDFFAVHHLILGHGVSLTDPVTFRAEDDGNSIVSEGVFENGQKLTFARSVKVLHIINKNTVNLQFECSYGSGDVDYIGVEARLDPADSKNLEEIAEHTKNQNRNLVNILATTAGTMDHTEHQNANLGDIRDSTKNNLIYVTELAKRPELLLSHSGKEILKNTSNPEKNERMQQFLMDYLIELLPGFRSVYVSKIVVSYDFTKIMFGNTLKMDMTAGINIPTIPVNVKVAPPTNASAMQATCRTRTETTPSQVKNLQPNRLIPFKSSQIKIDQSINTNSKISHSIEMDVNKLLTEETDRHILVSSLFNYISGAQASSEMATKMRWTKVNPDGEVTYLHYKDMAYMNYHNCQQNLDEGTSTYSSNTFYFNCAVYGYHQQ